MQGRQKSKTESQIAKKKTRSGKSDEIKIMYEYEQDEVFVETQKQCCNERPECCECLHGP